MKINETSIKKVLIVLEIMIRLKKIKKKNIQLTMYHKGENCCREQVS